jgi:trehalose 6-phosphate phosphatase
MPETADETTPLLDGEWLSELQDTLASANGVVLCLDFDGTLAPIVEDPTDATIASANRMFIRRLADQQATTVAIVSGRALPDLRERVDIDGIHYAGNHGLEWDDGDGRTVVPEARDAEAALQEALAELRPMVADIPGCHVEDKRLTATIHYRQVADEHVSTIAQATAAVVSDEDELVRQSGKQIYEIRPAISGGKDRVVDRLRDRHPQSVAVFVGDDVTDEDGFRAVGPDGYGVLVGKRSDTDASVRVPDPDGVTMLLAWLVKQYESADM